MAIELTKEIGRRQFPSITLYGHRISVIVTICILLSFNFHACGFALVGLKVYYYYYYYTVGHKKEPTYFFVCNFVNKKASIR